MTDGENIVPPRSPAGGFDGPLKTFEVTGRNRGVAQEESPFGSGEFCMVRNGRLRENMS